MLGLEDSPGEQEPYKSNCMVSIGPSILEGIPGILAQDRRVKRLRGIDPIRIILGRDLVGLEEVIEPINNRDRILYTSDFYRSPVRAESLNHVAPCKILISDDRSGRVHLHPLMMIRLMPLARELPRRLGPWG